MRETRRGREVRRKSGERGRKEGRKEIVFEPLDFTAL